MSIILDKNRGRKRPLNRSIKKKGQLSICQTREVAKTSNKVEIRQAVEAIFYVTVTKVNTLNVKSKPKRMRGAAGRTRTWKKAMVTLKEGDSIELFNA